MSDSKHASVGRHRDAKASVLDSDCSIAQSAYRQDQDTLYNYQRCGYTGFELQSLAFPPYVPTETQARFSPRSSPLRTQASPEQDHAWLMPVREDNRPEQMRRMASDFIARTGSSFIPQPVTPREPHMVPRLVTYQTYPSVFNEMAGLEQAWGPIAASETLLGMTDQNNSKPPIRRTQSHSASVSSRKQAGYRRCGPAPQISGNFSAVQDTSPIHRRAKKPRTHTGMCVCEQCGCTDSPEWRRGPNGPKSLCNACGLKFSKAEKLKRKHAVEAGTRAKERVSDADTRRRSVPGSGNFITATTPLPATMSNLSISSYANTIANPLGFLGFN